MTANPENYWSGKQYSPAMRTDIHACNIREQIFIIRSNKSIVRILNTLWPVLRIIEQRLIQTVENVFGRLRCTVRAIYVSRCAYAQLFLISNMYWTTIFHVNHARSPLPHFWFSAIKSESWKIFSQTVCPQWRFGASKLGHIPLSMFRFEPLIYLLLRASYA